MKRAEATGICIALGAGFGAALGVIFSNIGLGVAFGAGLGVFLGSLISWGPHSS